MSCLTKEDMDYLPSCQTIVLLFSSVILMDTEVKKKNMKQTNKVGLL